MHCVTSNLEIPNSLAILQILILKSALQAFLAIQLASSQIQAHTHKLHIVLRSNTNIQVTQNRIVLSTQYKSNYIKHWTMHTFDSEHLPN